jgi:hypothetical protein
MSADYIPAVPTINLTDAELDALPAAIRSGSPLPALRSAARAWKVRGGGPRANPASKGADPEAALEQERADAREGMRGTRANTTNVSRISDVDPVDKVFAAYLKLDDEQKARLIARIGDVIDKRARR